MSKRVGRGNIRVLGMRERDTEEEEAGGEQNRGERNLGDEENE